MSAPARDDPIFVVGTPRSGTTLLQSLVGAHPRIAAPPEVHFGRRILQFADYWGDLNDDDVLRRIVTTALDSPRLAQAGFEVERVFERARTGPRTFAGVLHAIMSDFTIRQGKQRWSEKTPGQGARGIWRSMPDAQVLHIVRDPRSSIRSAMATFGGWPDLLTAARAWRTFTLRNILAGAERGAAHYMRVRYEDLVQDPVAVMRLVFTFLGEDFDPAYVTDAERRKASLPSETPVHRNVLGPIRPLTQPGERGGLPFRTWLRLNASVADVLEPLGYAGLPRRLVLAGHILNAFFYPALGLRWLRAQFRSRLQRTPEQRYQAVERAHEERVRGSRRIRQRRAWRAGSQYNRQ